MPATKEAIDVSKFNLAELLLYAASELERTGQSPFTREQLCVKAWEIDGKRIGLKGFADRHLDSNRVFAAMAGEKGLHKRGLFVKLGTGVYALTREGRAVVQRLTRPAGEVGPANGELVSFCPHDAERLAGWFDSAALQKFNENHKAELSFLDACRFWGIDEKNQKAANELLKVTAADLEAIQVKLADHDGKMRSGRVVSAGDVRVLVHVHRYMQDRFERNLKLLAINRR